MRKTIAALALLLLIVLVFGFTGSDDLQTAIDTDAQTKEIKASMQKRDVSEKRDAEAYRQLFIERDESKGESDE